MNECTSIVCDSPLKIPSEKYDNVPNKVIVYHEVVHFEILVLELWILVIHLQFSLWSWTLCNN